MNEQSPFLGITTTTRKFQSQSLTIGASSWMLWEQVGLHILGNYLSNPGALNGGLMRPGKYYVRTVYQDPRNREMSVFVTRSEDGSKGAAWEVLKVSGFLSAQENMPDWILRGLNAFDRKGGSKVE